MLTKRPSTSVIIEPAAVADAAEILDLQKRAFAIEAELYQNQNIPPLTQTLEEIRAEFNDHLFLKACLEGRIVGSVRARMDGGDCLIGRLCVDPALHHQGIGTQLMAAIEAACPAARYRLFTGERSEGNLRLYHKLGYHAYKRKAVTETLTLIYLEKLNPLG
ncbi:amino-acid N-acetyltransferase [Anaerolineae bacterium]|nr:amino-acid N-acetyltransferase [Anaerolineae bacterium]